MRFKGKTILVVGGTSGIGAAAAMAFAREGGHVFLTGRRADAGQEIASRIMAAGGRAAFISADIRSSKDCRNMVKVALRETGRLDVAFNNAGILQSPMRLTEMEEDVWDDLIEVNLKGYFLAMKSEIEAMLPQRSGVIVNMASVNAVQGSARIVAYTAAKHAVAGLTRSAALDYIGDNIRINAICPAAVETELMVPMLEDPAVRAAVTAMHPIGRIASSEEIARTVLSIASDDCSFLVGQAVIVDGGMTAGVATGD